MSGFSPRAKGFRSYDNNMISYIYMPKKAISMTLGDENLLWLKARAMQKGGNLSAVLDQLVSEARAGRLGTPPAAKSVVGTIDLAADDPELQSGDKAIR